VGGDGLQPVSSRVKLIDFGSAIWNSNHHARVITTRQYRAPEVILNIGWSYAADIWSVGCLLAELRTGRLLFDTHEDLEHLALMEKVLQRPMPLEMGRKHLQVNSAQQQSAASKRMVRANGTVSWPERATSLGSRAHVEKQRVLSEMFSDTLFVDLMQKMLQWNPAARILPKDALRHPFFKQHSSSRASTNTQQMIQNKPELVAAHRPLPPASRQTDQQIQAAYAPRIVTQASEKYKQEAPRLV